MRCSMCDSEFDLESEERYVGYSRTAVEKRRLLIERENNGKD